MLNTLAGIIASSGGAAGGDYESIATVTVGSGGASSVEFTSIPSTYQHLQIRFIAKTGSSDNINFRYNSDSGANYAYHQLVGDGASASAAAATSASVMYGGYATAAQFGVGVLDILDYANTNKYKTMRSLHGSDANGSGLVLLRSGLWQNTNAINTIRMNSTGSNFVQYSSFTLYGIKG